MVHGRIERALKSAQKYSLVANSVKSEIIIEPKIEVVAVKPVLDERKCPAMVTCPAIPACPEGAIRHVADKNLPSAAGSCSNMPYVPTAEIA